MFESLGKVSLVILVTTGTAALMWGDPLLLVVGVIAIVCLLMFVNLLLP